MYKKMNNTIDRGWHDYMEEIRDAREEHNMIAQETNSAWEDKEWLERSFELTMAAQANGQYMHSELEEVVSFFQQLADEEEAEMQAEEYFLLLEEATEEQPEENYTRNSARGKAYQRKQAKRAKAKKICNSKVAQRNYVKRSDEDMRNGMFCCKRGGRRVNNPKSLTIKADKLYKKAEIYSHKEQERIRQAQKVA